MMDRVVMFPSNGHTLMEPDFGVLFPHGAVLCDKTRSFIICIQMGHFHFIAVASDVQLFSVSSATAASVFTLGILTTFIQISLAKCSKLRYADFHLDQWQI